MHDLCVYRLTPYTLQRVSTALYLIDAQSEMEPEGFVSIIVSLVLWFKYKTINIFSRSRSVIYLALSIYTKHWSGVCFQTCDYCLHPIFVSFLTSVLGLSGWIQPCSERGSCSKRERSPLPLSRRDQLPPILDRTRKRSPKSTRRALQGQRAHLVSRAHSCTMGFKCR